MKKSELKDEVLYSMLTSPTRKTVDPKSSSSLHLSMKFHKPFMPTPQPSVWSDLDPWQHDRDQVVIREEQSPDHTAVPHMLDDSCMTEWTA